LCFVDVPKIPLDSPDCLAEFVVHEFKIGRWVPDKAIDQTPKAAKPGALAAISRESR
jgi:hypothetical protein